MVHGLECFPGQYIGELFLYDADEQDEYEAIHRAYPDSMQLGGILGTPDKPELHVLAETLGDAEGAFGIKGGVGPTEHLPGFERLHEHEEGNTDSRYVAVAQAQINEEVGSAGRVDVAVGHVINEDKGAGPVQLHRLLVVHGHEQICIILTQPIRIVQPRLVYFLIALPSLILAYILICLVQNVP
jgi:hypothetical protein